MPAIATTDKALEGDSVRFVVDNAGSVLAPEERVSVITLGLVLESQRSGRSNNWKAAAGRGKRLRRIMRGVLGMVSLDQAVGEHLCGACTRVAFTRLAPRSLDDDNLRTAFKPIRDQLCAWLAGRNELDTRANDGLRSGYTFEYHQQKQRAYGIRIELRR